MSHYLLKIITQTSEKTIRFSDAKTITLQAEENTTYQIFNEQGQLITEPKIVALNQTDLAVSFEPGTQPNLILEGYYTHYPIESTQQLADISASLATASQETALVVASEVATAGVSNAVWIGAGAVATLGSTVGIAKLSKKNNGDSQKTAAENKPINLNVLWEPLATDNILNHTESIGKVSVSGKLVADQPFTQASVLLEIGDKQIEANVVNGEFTAEIAGELLREVREIKANATVSNGRVTSTATSTQTYEVDTVITSPLIILSPITSDNLLNIAESTAEQLLRGYVENVTNSTAKAGDKVVLQLGDEYLETVLKDDLSFELAASGQLLAKNRKIILSVDTEDRAGNRATATLTHDYGTDLVLEHPTISLNNLTEDNIINLRESGESLEIRGSVENQAGSEAKVGDKITLQIGGQTFTAPLNEQLAFSLDVNGQLLATQNTLILRLATRDRADNQLTTEKEHHYVVDKVIEDPHLSVNSVTEDGTLNAEELNGEVEISGQVTNGTNSAAKAGDIVTLEIGNFSTTAKLDDDLRFSKSIEGNLLRDHRRIDATLTTEDKAGNRLQTQAGRDYIIDAEIHHPKIAFEPLTADNIVNIAEAKRDVTLNGKVSNVNGSEAKSGDLIRLTVGGQHIEARLRDDLTFSVDVPGAALLNDERTISAALETADIAKNRLVTHARHNYFLDQQIADPTITLSVSTDNTVNRQESGERVVIHGKVENLSHSEAKPDDKVTVTLGGEQIAETRLQPDLTFSVEVDGGLLVNHSRLQAVLETEDFAKNLLTTVKTQDYIVDTDITPPTLVINPIAGDDILNAVEKRNETMVISGFATNVPHSAAKAGDEVVLTIGQSQVRGRLSENLTFEIPVSTIALVNHKTVLATLVTRDNAQNSATAEASRTVSVDDSLNIAVALNDITLDNTLNKSEAEGVVTLNGSYAVNENIKPGSVSVTVLVNNQQKRAEVNEQLRTWKLELAGQELATTEGQNLVTVTINAEDLAGNSAESTASHSYQVDTQITKPMVTITNIAGDNVIDANEAKGAITIKGIVENSEGDRPVVLLCPCTSCAGGWKEVEAQVVDGKFEVNVTVSETDLANAKLKSSERIVKAKYTAQDKAGNTAAADEASLNYKVDQEAGREINITKIGESFDLSEGASTRISGKINTFGASNASFDDIYNLGQNPRLVRMVKMVIDDKTYKVGFNGVTKSFYADIPNTELAALSGKSISLDFSDTFSTGINFYAAVFPMLTLIRNGVKVSDSVSNVVPTAKKFTLEGDVLVKNGDNSYSIKEIKPQMTEISGTVKGDIEVGAEIEVKVGDFTTTTVVKEGKVFSVEVEDHHLKNNTAQVVTAMLKNSGSDVVADSEVYILPKVVSSAFVSQHTEVPVSARRMDHTQDDYNFFYPIHLMETETTKRGALKNVAVGGTETPFVYKYHFLRTDEIANLPTNRVQGAIYNDRLKESEPGSIKEVTDLTKEMFRHAYKKLSEYTNIRFEEVNSWQEANGNNSELGTGTDGTLIFMSKLTGIYANAAAIGYQGGNVVWNETISGANPQKTDYNHYLALHEIMHTLNLRHAHESFSGLGRNAISGNVPTATAENHISEASGEFSHMSYWNVTTAMGDRDMRLYDLAYLHYRFGVNREHRAGDDVYTFKTYDTRKVDGDVYIWDGNGVDTFDASAEKEGVTVNLTPGSWNYRGTERKFNFLSDGRDIYDRYSYFGLDGSETIGGRVRNSFTERFNPVPDTANQVEIKKYQEGQSFIGYGTQIENLIGSKFADKLTGNNADNNIFGGAGDDTIIGGLGDDFINGGEGNDLMFGNQGNDTYVVDSAGDVVTEKATEGEADHIYSFINYELSDEETSHIEHLTLVGTTATQATGNALNNTIRGNDAGNTLNGMEGNDTLIGGLGVDTLTGGNGSDTFVFETTLNGKADTISDFVAGQDKIKLSKDIFTVIRQDLSNLKDHLFYDQASGELSYNSTTTGAANAVHFVTVAGLQNLDGDKFIIG